MNEPSKTARKDQAAELLRDARDALKAASRPAAIRELGDEVDDILRRYLAESEPASK